MNDQNFKNLPADYFQEPLAIPICKGCRDYVFFKSEGQDKEYSEYCRKDIRDSNILANEDIYS